MSYSCIYPKSILPFNEIRPNLIYYIHQKYEQDWKSEAHQHPFTEIFYVLNGRGTFQIENHPYPVEKNSLFIINPLIPHYEISSDTDPLDLIILGVENIQFFMPNDLLTHYEQERTSDSAHYFRSIDPHRNMLSALRNIEKELSNPDEYSALAVTTYLSLLLLLIRDETDISFSRPENAHYSQPVAAAKKYMDTYFSEPITLDMLAQRTFVSKFYLVHNFKKEIGQSPINYLMNVRISFAKLFLENSDYSIKKISELSGFNDYAYFSTVFRKLTGYAPKQYREKFREKAD